MTLEYLEIMEDIRKTTNDNGPAESKTKAAAAARRVRGVMTIREGDDMEFRAERKTGVSTQEQVAKAGDSKLYRTVGEKARTKVIAHLSVPADSADLRADLYEQVERLTRDTATKTPPRLKGRTLMNDADCRVTLSKKECRIEVVLGISLATHPDYVSRLLSLMQKVNQCFATNRTSLASVRG